MGRNTYCAVAPFVIKGQKVSDIISSLVKEDDTRLGTEACDENGMIIPIIKNGWKFYNDSVDKFKDLNKNTLLCDNLDKDGMELYVVNEHEYSNGGGESYCVFGFSAEALRHLRVDWDILETIIKVNDVVQQTL